MKYLAPFAVVGAFAFSPAAYAQVDSDNDGAADTVDVFPCDPSASAQAFAPAEGAWGTLLFEDEWPRAGDQDFNDLVLDYNVELTQDAAGRAVAATIRYHIAALGGAHGLGLGLHVPAPASAVTRVTKSVAGGPAVDLVPSATDAELSVDIEPVLSSLFVAPKPFNVVAGTNPVAGVDIVIDITFATPVLIDIATAPFDTFVFRGHDRRHEIHAPQYRGTSLMDTSLFGTGDDATTPSRAFIDTTGLPFVLDVPQSIDYPLEETHIAQLYPDILGFASSGGTSNQDYYVSTVQPAFAFAPRAQAPSIPAAASPDLSCLPMQSCLDLLNAGNTTSGTYTIDPDGLGGNAAIDVYCDMTTDGGGWTVIVGDPSYANGSFPFSPGLGGVSQSYPSGQYISYQGSSPSGNCHSPQPSISVVPRLPHREVRYSVQQRWHNATGSTFYVDFGNDGAVEFSNRTCGNACGQNRVWNFTVTHTRSHPVVVDQSRIIFVGRSCQNWGGSTRGYLRVYYIMVR